MPEQMMKMHFLRVEVEPKRFIYLCSYGIPYDVTAERFVGTMVDECGNVPAGTMRQVGLVKRADLASEPVIVTLQRLNGPAVRLQPVRKKIRPKR